MTRGDLYRKFREIVRECGEPDFWEEQGTPFAPVLVAFYPEATLVLTREGERWG